MNKSVLKRWMLGRLAEDLLTSENIFDPLHFIEKFERPPTRAERESLAVARMELAEQFNARAKEFAFDCPAPVKTDEAVQS